MVLPRASSPTLADTGSVAPDDQQQQRRVAGWLFLLFAAGMGKKSNGTSSTSAGSNATLDSVKAKVMDSLASVPEADRINFLVNRLTIHELDNAKIKVGNEQLELAQKKSALLEKKVDTLESMLTKTELSKAKLEELCRELNKTNKEITERSNQRYKLLEESHKQTVDHLKRSVEDIKISVAAKEQHSRSVADVEQLSHGLKDLSVEYEKRLVDLKKLYEEREENLTKIASSRDDEIAILKRELQEMHGNVQNVLKENISLKTELITNEGKTKTALESEVEMRKLLTDYTNKYQNLLHSLASSNESFERVKKEMGRMNGNLIRVEGDSRKWRTKLEETTNKVSELLAKRKEDEKILAHKNRQLEQLQELCRRLQAERLGGASPGTSPLTVGDSAEPPAPVDDQPASTSTTVPEQPSEDDGEHQYPTSSSAPDDAKAP